MDIELSGPKQWPEYLRVLVGGDPGTGKTTFATTFPNPFFVMCNGGEATLSRHHGIPFLRAESEQDLFWVKEQITSGDVLFPEYEIKTLVIDSLDDLQRKLLLSRLLSEGRAETKIEDWGWLAKRLNAIFETLANLPVHLVVTSKLNNETERLLLQGQFSEQIHNYVDYAFKTGLAPDADKLAEALRDAEVSQDGEVTPHLSETLKDQYVIGVSDDSWTHSLFRFGENSPSYMEATYENLLYCHQLAGQEVVTVPSERTVIKDIEGAKKILDEIFGGD